MTEDILKELMLLRAPSGYEKEMAYKLKDLFEGFADNVTIDKVGNTIAKFEGVDPQAPSVMVYAHMDQLGFIVRQIEADGYLRLERLGGIPEKVLPGLGLMIRTQKGDYIPGVIGNKSHHVMSAEEKSTVDPVGSLFVDIGARSADEVRSLGVDIGSPCVYKPSFEKLAGGKVCGTVADNRGGCACLVRIAQAIAVNRPMATVYLVGTVWEEFNLRGAMLAARELKPDIALCLDVSLSGDTPDLQGRFETKVGGGPAVSLYNFHGRGTLNGCIPHSGLVELAVETAEKDGIPLQRFATVGIITDAAYVQFENNGTASMDLCFPARYTHTPVEVCAPEDIENLGKLVCGMLGRIGPGFILNRY